MKADDPNALRENPHTEPVPLGTAETVHDAAAADPAPDLAELLKKAESEVADLRDSWLRARAEAENARRQAQADVARAHKYAVEKFAEDLLPVKDALEQALATENASPESLRSGVELTLKALDQAFGRAQLAEINPAVGDKFDPNWHQAMMQVESGQPVNTVVTVYQKGWMINDRILRPALVAVSAGRDAAA